MENLYCGGKRSYDKRSAQTALNLRYREDHVLLRMYQCDRGAHWHLTKQMRGTVSKFKRKYTR